jgi:hypothetical protein
LDICYSISVPESTVNTDYGDVFIQLKSPSTYEWIALGMGTQMAGAKILVAYAAGDGNVTISPRAGKGEFMPEFDSEADITLLKGSSVDDKQMIANVKCKFRG